MYTMHHKGAWIARGDAKCSTLCIYNIQRGTFVYIYTLYIYTIYMYTMHHKGECSQQSTQNATLSQKSTLHSLHSTLTGALTVCEFLPVTFTCGPPRTAPKVPRNCRQKGVTKKAF